MKYIKKFESEQELPEVGDYVLMRNKHAYFDVAEFISTHIGILKDIYFDSICEEYKFIVRYENIPGNIDLFFHDGTRIFEFDLLIAYGKTIDELSLRLQSNKFNI